MIIKFTKYIRDEDGLMRDDLINPKKVMLWSKHVNFYSNHPHARQHKLLIIGALYSDGGWFLSAKRFKEYVLDGTIIIEEV